MARSRKYELGVGLLLLGAAGVLGWMALQVGALSAFGDTVDVETRFNDIGGLQQGASVAIAGVQVGTVTELAIDFDRAIVKMSIDPDTTVLVDATAQVRARSVLGEKYVELVPHSRDARPIQDGDILQAGPDQTEIDELVSAIGPLVDAVDPAVFQQVLGSLATALQDDPNRLTRMLANADLLLANGAEASRDLPAAVSEARATLGAVRGTLGRADRAIAKADGLLDQAEPMMADLQTTTSEFPQLASDARMTLQQMRDLIASFDSTKAGIDQIVANFSEFDGYELRRLLREEGILVRLRAREVVEEPNEPFRRRGSVR